MAAFLVCRIGESASSVWVRLQPGTNWTHAGPSFRTAPERLRSPHRPSSNVARMIEVCDYDPAWADRFDALRAEYTAALREAMVRHRVDRACRKHRRSWLAAKPVIDIDVVVNPPTSTPLPLCLSASGSSPVASSAYQRWAFWEPARLAGTNTYVIVSGLSRVANYLAVRDMLRDDPDLRAEYGEVKKRVGAMAADLYEYGAGKNAAVQRILARARLSDEERASIDAIQVPVTERRR